MRVVSENHIGPRVDDCVRQGALPFGQLLKLFAPMDVKDLGMLYTGPNRSRILLVANNNFGMQTFAETLSKKP